MPKVEANISMSLDGFITGPNLDKYPGLGEGGEILHAWTGIFGAGIPTTLFLVGIRWIGGVRAGILALFEPVVGTLLAAALLAGVYPALAIARTSPALALKEEE